VSVIDGLDRIFEEFSLLTAALNNREGTIGQLIHNPNLYENANRLAYNANVVVGQLHELLQRLRPVVEDARTFMSKIATEPGRIISGAINPSQIKGTITYEK
jgi:phospholipid/cholesterol/gamma-HCH transport system substrate-binding protein